MLLESAKPASGQPSINSHLSPNRQLPRAAITRTMRPKNNLIIQIMFGQSFSEYNSHRNHRFHYPLGCGAQNVTVMVDNYAVTNQQHNLVVISRVSGSQKSLLFIVSGKQSANSSCIFGIFPISAPPPWRITKSIPTIVDTPFDCFNKFSTSGRG